jgi:ABC-type Zn uptake system ZnuABC Zn-binding protein ZnuA
VAPGTGHPVAQPPDSARAARQPRLLDRHPGAGRPHPEARPLDGRHHPRGNPHYWIPPENAVRIARELANRLKQIDPPGAGAYEAGLARFRDEVSRRLPGWRQKAAPLKGLKVVTYHKSWSYVSAWLGLVEMGYVEPKPGVPPSPQHLANLIAYMKREGVTKVLMEMFYPRNMPDAVARNAGARLLVLPADVGAFPAITDYYKLVDALLDLLLK